MLTPHYKEQGDTGKRKEEKSMAEMEEVTSDLSFFPRFLSQEFLSLSWGNKRMIMVTVVHLSTSKPHLRATT